MTAIPTADLPAALTTIRTRPLFVLRLSVKPIQVVGPTPGAFRRIGVVDGGTFVGERLSGAVTEGGSDWMSVRSDDATVLDVRLVLRTQDGDLIGMTYRGLRHGPADVIAKINAGEAVEPDSYYFRIIPMFETASQRYDWLNRIVAVGAGHREPGGPVYSVFEVL